MKSNHLNAISNKLKSVSEELEATQTLISDLPDFIPDFDRLVYHNSSLCEFSVRYTAKSISEITHILKYWDDFIAPLYLTRGTFTSFRTSWHKPDATATRVEKVAPITVMVSQHGVELQMYAMVSGHLLRVVIDVASMPSPLAQIKVEKSSHSRRIKSTNLETPGFCSPEYIKWASDDRTPNQFTIYWKRESVKSFREIFK